MDRIQLSVDAGCISRFYPLLEKGVTLTTNIGCTIRTFLCDRLGVSNQYLEHRIQTLFLDFKPVDDVDQAIIRDGSILALSSAMPGLVGATMRKGGRYAVFRKSISQTEEESGACESPGHVTIKLFNMVAKEIGNHLLESGVELAGMDLRRMVDRCMATPPPNILQMQLNDQKINPENYLDPVFFQNRLWVSITATHH